MGRWFISTSLIGVTPVLFWAWPSTFCGARAYINNLNHPKFSLSAFFWQCDLLDLAKETSCQPVGVISSLACPLGTGACVTTGPQAGPAGRSPRTPWDIWLSHGQGRWAEGWRSPLTGEQVPGCWLGLRGRPTGDVQLWRKMEQSLGPLGVKG